MARRRTIPGMYESGLSRQERSAISQAARAEGVRPSLLAALVMGESGGRHTRPGSITTSSAGAQGYGQLMPGTARGLGVDPYDPVGNLRGSARYLGQQMRRFGGRADLALSAYNSGPGGLESSGQVEKFAETQRYVQTVMALEKRYKNMAAGGIGMGPITPGAPTNVELATGDMAHLNGRLASIAASLRGKVGPLSQRVQEDIKRRQTALAAAPEDQQMMDSGMSLLDMQTGDTGMFQPQGGGGKWAGSREAAYGIIQGTRSGHTSEKRSKRTTSSGGVSDHWTGNKNAYAIDAGGSKEQMHRDAALIANRLGVQWDGRSELVVTKTIGNYRYQLIYNTPKYGGHLTHWHLGVKRVGGRK